MSEQPTGSPTPGPSPETTPDARLWGMLCHLTALAGYLIPFGNLIGPIIIWAIKKDEHPFVDEQGKESINFQITVTLAVAACFALFFLFLPLLLIPIIGIAALVLVIIASIKANSGESYRYPLTLRLVK